MVKTKYKPAQGRFLLSEPFLKDPNFKRTVVLLTEHGDEGSVGFILNRPTDLSLKDVIPGVDFDLPVYLGGPVQQDSVHFIHQCDALKDDSIEILKGMYWGGDFQRLRLLADTGQVDLNDFRFFLGYSGWGPNQLETEMEDLSWIVSPANKDFIFDPDPTSLWPNILRSMGTKFKIISNYPEDPTLN